MSRPPQRSFSALAVIALAAAAFTAAAWLTLFSAFMLYDDEGYVLFSIKNFVEHGRLYRDVYSQYGPFLYVLYDGLHALGMPLTHMAGRILTVSEWAGSAILATAIVWRVTRDVAMSLACLAGTFIYLWVMLSEPTHPGGLIAFMTAVLAAFGYAQLASGRTVRWAAVTGAGIAALLLTKVNVGAFATMAAGTLWLLFHRSGAVRRAAPWFLAVCLAILPFGLMKALLGTPWVDTFAVFFAISGVLAVVAAARIREEGPRASAEGTAWPGFGGPELAAAAAACAAIGIVVLGVTLAKGSSPADLLQGIILGPLQHPVHFSLNHPWRHSARVSAAVSCLLLAGAACLARKPERRAAVDTAVAALRLAAAMALAGVLLTFPFASPDREVMSFAGPCLWVFLWPLAGERFRACLARAWLGFLFLGQWLHAYPVPGSQIAWGTFLFLPLAALGAWEAAVWFARRPARAGTSPVRAAAIAARLALVAFAAILGLRFSEIGKRYFDSRPLDLPGAESLRLPDSSTALYRLFCLNAVAHADVLFSMPGMFSFNLWTGLPAPTFANVTHWFSLLDSGEQAAILRSLEAHPRSCVIVQRGHLDFLRRMGIVPSGPLADAIARDYVTAFTVDEFEFKVKRGRRIFPLSTAELYWRKGDIASGAYDSLLRIRTFLPPGSKIASVEIAPMDGFPSPSRVLSAVNCRVEATPVTLAGDARAPTKKVAFPFSAPGPEMIDVYFGHKGRLVPVNHSWVILRGEDGSELALVRLLP